MGTAPDSIAPDQESGLILIPPSKHREFALGVSVWGGPSENAFHAFVQHEVASGGLERMSSTLGRDTVLPVKVQLVPRPDNDYNPKAISVAAPPEHGGTNRERHLGYMYDRNLVSLGGPLRGLAYVAEQPVGCHAYVDLHQVDPQDHQEGEEDTGPVVTAPRNLVYSYSGIRLLMPWWEDLQQMAIAYARTVRPGQILPFTGHWASWKPGARQEVSARTEESLFPVTLRVEDGQLLAYHRDLLLACLWPSGRDFFDRTMVQVQELGGAATAYAEAHEGSIKVYVEDNNPLP
ncbi:hypothetical protein AB0B78_24030 [Streptomyces sp. NPDC040724]|uniref:hypothetical protein n=1 Tax=Streptomyces sp. NPDC040724 TaxID=3155612 RepID=UPI0033F6F7EB